VRQVSFQILLLGGSLADGRRVLRNNVLMLDFRYMSLGSRGRTGSSSPSWEREDELLDEQLKYM
jgi:hypothetical protein